MVVDGLRSSRVVEGLERPREGDTPRKERWHARGVSHTMSYELKGGDQVTCCHICATRS